MSRFIKFLLFFLNISRLLPQTYTFGLLVLRRFIKNELLCLGKQILAPFETISREWQHCYQEPDLSFHPTHTRQTTSKVLTLILNKITKRAT
ncbi:hypothetical protein QBC44DRAFT_152370 [Cladorrhinum sp. PSN332]|nr:hypothetical protein QBC44DRAFT_152370 [Cladorrhinum sp. PSN332]